MKALGDRCYTKGIPWICMRCRESHLRFTLYKILRSATGSITSDRIQNRLSNELFLAIHGGREQDETLET